ncbi:MAG: bifunctional adenosylcobinamide kinase/adenosylcobinamide-phosphate guanylyltransferase [Nitrospirota bacterium]
MSIKMQGSGVKGQGSGKNLKLRTSNSELIFILGGARSGKSSFALRLAESIGSRNIYIATAEALDEEMAERIKRHKENRGKDWQVIEAPINITGKLAGLKRKGDVILIDCLTLWVNNQMEKMADKKILKETGSLLKAVKAINKNIIIVSNEVGLGIVPDNPLARRFRDIAGMVNQKIAEAADEVYLMVSGIPVRVK